MSSILYNDKLYGGATTALDADHVLYDNTDSGLTSSNIQDVVDEIYTNIESIEADDVDYDNTNSGLIATNVQDAVDELGSNILGDFASIETSSVASKAYAVGDYLMYNSKFYKVTSAIAQGGTITPNTNVVQTNVGAELTGKMTSAISEISYNTSALEYQSVYKVIIGNLISYQVALITKTAISADARLGAGFAGNSGSYTYASGCIAVDDSKSIYHLYLTGNGDLHCIESIPTGRYFRFTLTYIRA